MSHTTTEYYTIPIADLCQHEVVITIANECYGQIQNYESVHLANNLYREFSTRSHIELLHPGSVADAIRCLHSIWATFTTGAD